LGICVVRLTEKIQIKYNTSLAYNIYTVLCTVKFKDMIIKNKNGEFAVTAPQYNFLTHNFIFNEINSELVGKTNFITSTWDYDKAHETVKKDEKYKNMLRY
jgi:hypothetical protein